MTRPAPRIDALTGLRIFPALAVLLSHMGDAPAGGPFVNAFMDAGYAGVTIFFVLSGFVLAHNYFDRFAEQLSLRLLRSYCAARLARVYPLYFIVLVWVSVPELVSAEGARLRAWLRHALAMQAWASNVHSAYAFNPPGWSISVELFLYACFPVLVPILARWVRTPRRTLGALVTVGLAMASAAVCFIAFGHADLPWTEPGSAHRWLYRNPACRLGDFLLGVLAARLLAQRGGAPLAGAQWLAAASGASIVCLMCWPRHVYTAPSWDFSYAVPATALIFSLAAAPTSAPARALSTRPLLFLGEASYALYLCHWYVLTRLLPSDIAPSHWLSSRLEASAWALVLAAALHIAIERPCRALLRRMLDPVASDAPLTRVAGALQDPAGPG